MDVVKNVHPLLLLVVITIISDVYGKRCTFLGPHCNNDEFCCNNNRECCSGTVLAVWVIIVIVIGCVLFISCCVAVICCLVKQSHRPGQVIQPVQQPGVSIVATGHQGQPGTGQPMYG
ncbi:uncharacterized protein LOC123553501 [Mercenaria mercenaria]|uniref:uncharacterized protein LOC123553501 n=1 Tax=Mercenaria mercenaria TaxID=6596 RepID=UPI00234EBA23|nr:uncharacterized protein LOC123553501 [Mercenaria mercenaria]